MSLVDLTRLDQAWKGISVPFVTGCDFLNICHSERHHLSESNWPRGFCTGGATNSQARTHRCPLVDKRSREQGNFFLDITVT